MTAIAASAARPGSMPKLDVDPATQPGGPLDHDIDGPSSAPTKGGGGIPASVGLPLLLGIMVVGNVAVFGHFSPRTTACMGVGIAGVAAAAAGYDATRPGKSGRDRAVMAVAGVSMLGIAGIALHAAAKLAK